MIRIGTAGWSIRGTIADEFPGGGTHLQRHAGRFDAVEINSSFYRPHRRATYERWSGSVPDSFRFAVKAPESVTHERRLCHCDELVDRFVAEASGLGDKLGVILVQLPPTLQFDRESVTRFCPAAGTGWSTTACTARRACTGRNMASRRWRALRGGSRTRPPAAPRHGVSSTIPPPGMQPETPCGCGR